MKAMFVPLVAALAGISSAAEFVTRLEARQSIDEAEVKACGGLSLDGIPTTAEDCAPVIKHFEDNPDGETYDNDKSPIRICEGKCTVKLATRLPDEGISNRAIADAAKKITEECSAAADGEPGGEITTSDGGKDFYLAVIPAPPGGCEELN